MTLSKQDYRTMLGQQFDAAQAAYEAYLTCDYKCLEAHVADLEAAVSDLFDLAIAVLEDYGSFLLSKADVHLPATVSSLVQINADRFNEIFWECYQSRQSLEFAQTAPLFVRRWQALLVYANRPLEVCCGTYA